MRGWNRCVIVTEANDLMRPIHDRMPLLLDPETWDTWLEPEAHDPSSLVALLKPYPAEAMTAWPIGARSTVRRMTRRSV